MNFGTDNEIAVALSMNYVTGSWTGSISAHCQARIDQQAGWVNDLAEPQQVKRWAQSMIAALTAERDKALQDEAEFGR